MYVYFHLYTVFSRSSNDGWRCYVITKEKIMRRWKLVWEQIKRYLAKKNVLGDVLTDVGGRLDDSCVLQVIHHSKLKSGTLIKGSFCYSLRDARPVAASSGSRHRR